MDVRQLKYFVAITESGSFSQAAQKLFVSQPSLSQQIAGLEAELKTKLLLRSAQGVAPTPAGSLLYRRAKEILRKVEQIREEIHLDNGGESGPVSVGLPTTIASVLGPALFTRIRKRFPGIRLQLFESMSGFISEMLANGRLDIAMLFRDSETRGMSVIPLFDEDLYLIGNANPSVGDHDSTCPLSALANVPLVAPSSNNGLRLVIERTFQREDVDLSIVADVDSLPMLIAIAAEGGASTILPASALAQHDPASRPAMRRIVEPEMTRPVSVCWSHAVPVSAAALAVRIEIAALVSELFESGKWTGISLRPVPDKATLSDTGGKGGTGLRD